MAREETERGVCIGPALHRLRRRRGAKDSLAGRSPVRCRAVHPPGGLVVQSMLAMHRPPVLPPTFETFPLRHAWQQLATSSTSKPGMIRRYKRCSRGVVTSHIGSARGTRHACNPQFHMHTQKNENMNKWHASPPCYIATRDGQHRSLHRAHARIPGKPVAAGCHHRARVLADEVDGRAADQAWARAAARRAWNKHTVSSIDRSMTRCAQARRRCSAVRT